MTKRDATIQIVSFAEFNVSPINVTTKQPGVQDENYLHMEERDDPDVDTSIDHFKAYETFCPYCRTFVTTETTYKIGQAAYLWCFAIAMGM